MSANVLDLPIPQTQKSRSLFNPFVDFLLLGGGSLFALLILRALLTGEEGLTTSFLMTVAFANVINHPHFAHSYQIFYRDFYKKLTVYPDDLRRRYFVSGIVVPAALITFFAVAILFEMPRLLGLAANVMAFSVGWHYVKQGYGMAMVDAVLKRAFYGEKEKKAFLQNAFATWIFSWALVNYLVDKDPKYFGIAYFLIPIPLPLLIAAGAICALTSARLAITLWQRKTAGRAVAVNGLISYGVSLYAWLLIRDPIVLLWVPVFHSLQYLAVVWRFELNRSRSSHESSVRASLKFWIFIAVGTALGYLGFWAAPLWLDANVNYSRELFGTSLFLFVFWIFINIHHYFLDTVMWRKGNPDVQAHLFSH